MSDLAEVSFLLGKYDAAAALWQGMLSELSDEAAKTVNARLEKIAADELPRVPAVDYLQAVAGAMDLKEAGAYLDASAILTDVIADAHFCIEFPLPQIPYLLALCSLELGSSGEARVLLQQALRMNPDFPEAQKALANL
jgi:tetratricopeptide (TPR) repeat protein